MGKGFSNDPKWLEAKRSIGRLDWIEVVSYYRYLGGKNIFVYIIRDKTKKLIIDFIDSDGNVILLNRNKELEIQDYESVDTSKKEFVYAHDFETSVYEIEGQEFKVATEKVEERLEG